MNVGSADVRVLHVINRLGVGGAEKQLGQLVERSRLAHEVIELHDRSLRTLARLNREIRTTDAHVVVGWLDRSQIALACAAMGLRLPLVASVRGLPRRTGIPSRWSMRMALARYRMIVTNSDASRKALISFMRPLGNLSVTVIPNGVERVEDSRSPLSGDGPLTVGFIGRANRDKGLDVMLQALSRLDGSEVRAVLIGKDVPSAVGSRADALPQTRLFGDVSNPWDVAGELDVLVVPSRSEGLPNVVIEAFARGVPVVATAVGGTTDLVGSDRGLLVPSEDPAALALALRQVKADPVAALDRAARARLHAETVHDWSNVVYLWDEFLTAATQSHQ